MYRSFRGAVCGLALLVALSLAACGGDGGAAGSGAGASATPAPESGAGASETATPKSGAGASKERAPKSGAGTADKRAPKSGSGASEKRAPKSRAGASTKTARVSQARVAPEGLPEIPELRDAAGALADVEPGECTTKPGDIEVAGTVRNPTEEATDYAITVSWINDRSDVRGRAVATVKDLAPGRSAEWAAKTKLEADNATQCTFFVQRGSLAG